MLLQYLWPRTRHNRGANRQRRSPRRFRPLLETLEERLTPTVPLTISTNDGFTFSGFTQSQKTGAVEFFESSPFGPFDSSPAGAHQPEAILTWNRGEVSFFLQCDPDQQVFLRSDTVTNKVVVHHSADLTASPGDVTAVKVVIPSFINDDLPGAPANIITTQFPLEALGMSVTITPAGGVPIELVALTLQGVDPVTGAATFGATLGQPAALNGPAQVDVTLAGQVEPALSGMPVTGPQGCADPNIQFSQDSGLSQLVLQNMSVVLFVEQQVASKLAVHPGNVPITVNETQLFTAFSCSVDANGNADFGPDGVPGTSDDLCTPKEATWSASGGIGTVSPTTGTSTTLTPAILPSFTFVTGEVTAFDCPRDANGNPDLGPDGVPGTSDDLCTPKATASVTVTTPIVVRDSDRQETASVLLFEPGRGDENRIAALQRLYGVLDALANRFAGNPGRVQQRLAALFAGLRNRAAARIDARVPADARYTVTAPDLGNGDVDATLTSKDAAGDPIETYDLVLRPGSPLHSGPIIPVPAGGKIRSGRFGNLLFVAAEVGGTQVAQVPGFDDAIVNVLDGDRPRHHRARHLRGDRLHIVNVLGGDRPMHARRTSLPGLPSPVKGFANNRSFVALTAENNPQSTQARARLIDRVFAGGYDWKRGLSILNADGATRQDDGFRDEGFGDADELDNDRLLTRGRRNLDRNWRLPK